MRPGITLLAMIFLIGLWSCTAASLPQATPALTPPPAAGTAKTGWEERWNKTLAAARQEGELLVYLNATDEARPAMTEALRTKFGINLDVVVGTGTTLSAKLISEYQAGIFLADASVQGSNTLTRFIKPKGFLAPLEPMLILPEVVDPRMWYGDKFPYLDNDKLVADFIHHVAPTVIYNTQMLKKDQIVSYRDLLRPEFKGKIVMYDPRVGGPGAMTATFLSQVWGIEETKTYLSALVRDQETVITRDYRQQVEWVARGKYPIGLAPSTGPSAEFIKTGAPIAFIGIMKEGNITSASFGGIGIPTKPAHPNAVTVFLNWLLSREGQTMAVKTMFLPSARKDVPPTGILDELVVKPGEKYTASDLEFAAVQDKLTPEWTKALDAVTK